MFIYVAKCLGNVVKCFIPWFGLFIPGNCQNGGFVKWKLKKVINDICVTLWFNESLSVFRTVVLYRSSVTRTSAKCYNKHCWTTWRLTARVTLL